MVFRPHQRRQTLDISIQIDNNVIERVKETVFLGVILDEHLSWKPHILSVSRKISKSGVANGTSKNVGLGKFWQDLEISEAFLMSLEVSFFHGLFLYFLNLETFHQRVSGLDF